MNKGTAIVGFLLCFLAGMGLMWGIDRNGQGKQAGITAEAVAVFDDKSPPWSDQEASVPVTSKDPMWGSRTAPVTLVLFSDFECPFCSKVEATLNQVKETYGPEKLRVFWKNNPLPFHKAARPASLAANTVFALGGSKAFWKFHELAFQNQRALTTENFEAWAATAGVDKAKFKAAFDAKQFDAKIDTDMTEGKGSGVTGTPASFINGVFLSGAQPLEKFKAIIDEQLKAADAKKAAGVKPDRVYVELSKENKAKNPAPKSDDKPKQDDKTVWKVTVNENNAVRGPVAAPITIVLFSDFQCPFCSKVGPTLEEVMKAYPEKVRIVWKNNPLPFHPRAAPAATLAMEARAQKGDKGFWAAHDMLFKNQQKLADEDLLGYAKELALDVDKVKAAIADQKYQAIYTADQDQADDLQAQGTPHMFINGRRIVGAQPVDAFKTIIDEEMKKANDLLAKGVKPADLYNETIKDGKEPPPPEKKAVEAASADAPFKGARDAKVALYIYSDFECPFCKRVGDTLAQVEKTYGEKIKTVWRHKPLPMHKNAPLASEASQEIFKQKGSDGFWKYHDRLFKEQGSPDALLRASLEKYAEEQGGIDMGKFKAALDKNAHKAFVEAESATGDKAGISGTPAFVIGTVKEKELTGYFISGAQPIGKFKKAIERALKDAAAGGVQLDSKPAADAKPGDAKPGDAKPTVTAKPATPPPGGAPRPAPKKDDTY